MEDIHAELMSTVRLDRSRESNTGDAFLWKGSPDATFIQRIGLWLFGLYLVGLGAGMIAIGRGEDSLLAGGMGLAGVFLGLKLCRNGSMGRKREKIANDKTS
jgi:hypothetical protein